MKIPTDLKIIDTIYKEYHNDFISYKKGDSTRASKTHVPIDCEKIANILKVDPDIVFGRLYYHLEEKYGYQRPDGMNVHFFALVVENDYRCVNFPFMTSILAALKQENKRFWIGTLIAITALVVSFISLTISATNTSSSNRPIQPTIEVRPV